MIEKLIDYFKWCERCMYGYPDNWYKNASDYRSAYKHMAFGAARFMKTIHPELTEEINDLLDNEWTARLIDTCDSYFTK